MIHVALFTLVTAISAADKSESEFLWQKAWSRTLSAASEEEYAQAARDYGELVSNGIRNKHIFYNMGTALLLAGQEEQAIRALERAELYGGADQRVIHNIAIAYSDGAAGTGHISWQRIIFFWHFALPLTLRINIAIGAWAALFGALSLGRKKAHAFRPLVISALTVLVIFGSSALTSALQEHKERIRDAYFLDDQPLEAQATE